MPWGSWRPERFERFERVLGTSTRPAIVQTDAGRAYVKALGNPEGPHALATELVGTRIADLLGLPTLDIAILPLDATVDEIPLNPDPDAPFAKVAKAESGPALATRAIEAEPWSSDPARLRDLVNPEDLAGLVLVDTWLANPDRHPVRPPRPDGRRKPNFENVLFEHLPGRRTRRVRLIAMDFTACLHRRSGALRSSYPIELIQDHGVYGLFPSFEPWIEAASFEPFLARTEEIVSRPQDLAETVASIPEAWDVDSEQRAALVELLRRRGDYLGREFVANFERCLASSTDIDPADDG